MPEHHHDSSRGIELDDHVRSLIDGPDVVLRVHTHRVRELEAVVPLADFANILAILIELEQTCVGAPCVNKNMSLGIGRNTDRFAHIQSRRKLQEVWYGLVRNFGHVLRFSLDLRENRAHK